MYCKSGDTLFKVCQVFSTFRLYHVLQRYASSTVNRTVHLRINESRHLRVCKLQTLSPSTTLSSSYTITNPCTSSTTSRSSICSVTLRACWKCGNSIKATNSNFEEKNLTALFYCQSLDCGVLQPPSAHLTYFQLFGMDNVYDIDTKLLTKTYRKIQQKLHPDKSSSLSEIERRYSDDQSALVNKAYDTLLQPVSRAIYLLGLHGQTLEEDQIPLDSEFLMTIMELNEEIAATDDHEVLKEIFSDNKQKLHQHMTDISEAFIVKDIDKAKLLISKVKYFVNIEDKLKDKVYFI